MEEVNAEEDRAVKDVWVMVKLIFIRSMDYGRVVYVVYIYTCYSCARSFDVRAEELDYIKTHSCLRFIFVVFFLKHRLEKKHVSQKSEIIRSEGPFPSFPPPHQKKKKRRFVEVVLGHYESNKLNSAALKNIKNIIMIKYTVLLCRYSKTISRVNHHHIYYYCY